MLVENLNSEEIKNFESDANKLSFKLLKNAIDKAQKRSEENHRNLKKEESIFLTKLSKEEQKLCKLHFESKVKNQEKAFAKKRSEKGTHLSTTVFQFHKIRIPP